MIIFIIIPSKDNNEAVLIMMNSLKQEHIYKDGLEEDKKEIKFNKLVTYCQNSLHCDTLVEGPINKANQSSDIECQSTAILKGILLRDSKI